MNTKYDIAEYFVQEHKSLNRKIYQCFARMNISFYVLYQRMSSWRQEYKNDLKFDDESCAKITILPLHRLHYSLAKLFYKPFHKLNNFALQRVHTSTSGSWCIG